MQTDSETCQAIHLWSSMLVLRRSGEMIADPFLFENEWTYLQKNN